jgi:hypothetical protein
MIKTTEKARCWWFMPLILAIWEAEIGRFWFKTSPGKKFTRPPPQSIARYGGMHLLSQVDGIGG